MDPYVLNRFVVQNRLQPRGLLTDLGAVIDACFCVLGPALRGTQGLSIVQAPQRLAI